MSMETAGIAARAPVRYTRVAAPLHTMLVLAASGAWALRGILNSDQMRTAAHPNHIAMYGRTMLFEWLLFGFVILGVKLHGTSLLAVLGERWNSVLQVLRDVGIALVLLVASIILESILGSHLHHVGPDPAVQFLLPHGGSEITMWMALSLTAGICEETLFRGYLQKQFMVLTQSAPLGILFSAMMFGLAHGYQGFSRAAQIGVLGVMYGILTHWRRSIRPGMISHTLQDVLGGLFAGSIRH
jgi:membrane protease YdiL (CAAX protease family)